MILKIKDDDEVNAEQGKQKMKRKNQWKGFMWTILILYVPLSIISGYILYHLEFKEKSLEMSYSPNQQHTIEVVEQGQTTDFGPSSIRLKYKDQYLDRIISNDGEELTDKNVTIEWTSEDTALITLAGAEQQPEFIEFNGNDSDSFDTVQMELESNLLVTSSSPDQTNRIEVKEVIQSKGSEDTRFLRLYYGDEQQLDDYQDVEYVHGAETYTVKWTDNNLASVAVSGDREVMETYQVKFPNKP